MAPAIIPATHENAAAISALGMQTFRESFGHLFPEDVLGRYLHDTFNEGKIAASLAKPHNHYFLTCCDGEPIGYMKIKSGSRNDLLASPAQWQLQKLYILNRHQNLKLGAAFMQHALTIFAGKAPLTCWLAALDENLAAQRFYARFGFAPCGETFHAFEHRTMRFIVMRCEFL